MVVFTVFSFLLPNLVFADITSMTPNSFVVNDTSVSVLVEFTLDSELFAQNEILIDLGDLTIQSLDGGSHDDTFYGPPDEDNFACEDEVGFGAAYAAVVLLGSGEFTVTACDDTTGSGIPSGTQFDLTFTVDIGATPGTITPQYDGGSSTYSYTITPAPAISVTEVDTQTDEDGDTATVQFELTTMPSSAVTIPLLIDDTTEGDLGGVTEIVISPANWDQPANNEVTITGVSDAEVDGDIVYNLITGDPTSSDSDYNALGAGDVADVSLTNLDTTVAAVPEFTDFLYILMMLMVGMYFYKRNLFTFKCEGDLQ